MKDHEQTRAELTGSDVDSLIAEHLEEVSVDETTWNILYRDSTTGEYWELYRPFPDAQGGGPKRLRPVVNPDDNNN